MNSSLEVYLCIDWQRKVRYNQVLMNVAVTGATGFIGSNLVERLVKKKFAVTILIRHESDKLKFSGKPVTFVNGDLLDKKSLLKLTSKMSIVFNCAATLPHHNVSRKEHKNTNVIGVQNVLDACIKNKVSKLIHISTIGVFGQSDEIIDEDADVRAYDDYSETKAAGDLLLKNEMGKKRLNITIIRPTICYGPGDTRPGFINLFQLVKKGIFIPIGDGSNYFHTIYIENLIDACFLAFQQKRAIGDEFIIGDDPCPSMGKIVSGIYKASGRKKPSFYLPLPVAYAISLVLTPVTQVLGIKNPLPQKRVSFITDNRRYNINKAKRYLGYKPKISLNEGIMLTYEWYKQKGYI